VVFHEGSISRILDGSDYVGTVEDRVGDLIEKSLETKNRIERDREELSGVKKEKERLLIIQNSQKKGLLEDKRETQSDIAEKEATIEDLRKKLAELQSDLNILTGRSYDAKDIREAVEFASKETGVPKGVLYGFLKMETNLGANTGQCTYKEVEKVSVARYKKYGSKYKKSIDLLYKRRDIFYEIVKALDYSKDKKVSCSPNYIGQGGAMGVAQFMSDTWRGYEAQIRAKTGHKNPDPWNLTDGVMALALKTRNAGATSDSASAIKKASINYLGAFNKGYYEGIVYWSKNYKVLFN
jgi:membrane-bound lytic murein transglycosylase B